MPDRLFVFIQHIFPKLALTIFSGWVANWRGGAATTWIIRTFVRKYNVNMAEAAQPDITAYPTFNEFFTRALKPGVRPIADAPLVCPVDGAISQFGEVKQGQIFQAKGHSYSTTALVGGDAQLAAQFNDASFATIYLSPRDYHRIHMPCDGKLLRTVYVPGALYSVNPVTARGVPGLFARNERVVCVFDSERGPWVLVLVGATIVGSMATVWQGVVNPPRSRQVREWHHDGHSIAIAKGEEMGRFLLGSTVVMLFPRGMGGGAGAPLAFNPSWAPGGAVRLGEPMATAA